MPFQCTEMHSASYEVIRLTVLRKQISNLRKNGQARLQHPVCK